MRGIRIPQDLNGQDRIALGLSAGGLAVLLLGLLAAYTIVHLDIPLAIRIVGASITAALTAALAWLRPAGQSLLHWILVAAQYRLSHRRPAPGRIAQLPQPKLQVLPDDGGWLSTPAGPALDDEGVVELSGPALPSPSLPAAVPEDGETVPVYLGGTQVLVFFSTKGGTGRTTLATEVASLLAARGWYRINPLATPERLRVALLDLDTGSSNVAVHLGLTHPTLLDWIADGRSPSTCRDYLLVHRPSNLRVLIGSPRCLTPAITEGISGSGALAILDSLKAEGYHFVFVDIGPVIGDLEAAVLQAADRIFCVVTPSPSSVQDLYRSVEVLRRMGLSKRIGYVANMVRESCDLSVPMSDLGGTLAAQIPFDLAFQAAENRHEPLSINGRGAPQNAILQLAGSIYPAFATRPMRSGLTAFPWFSRRRHAG